ncbi:hypothetical protein [Gordonia sp. 852002-10350_SCH5691597]|nr:hypothetical protein [Gordonia sp. 852002-10350_SCH5691597]
MAAPAAHRDRQSPGRETARKWAKENGVSLGNDVLADLVRTVKKEIEEP